MWVSDRHANVCVGFGRMDFILPIKLYTKADSANDLLRYTDLETNESLVSTLFRSLPLHDDI
jgi:hypothetical protein